MSPAEKPLMKDFIGINGHTVGFNPELYAPVCRLVRDYHPYLWDVHDKPGAATALPMAQHIDWEDKSGKFRSWHKPVNWKELYSAWIKAGLVDYVMLMSYPPDLASMKKDVGEAKKKTPDFKRVDITVPAYKLADSPDIFSQQIIFCKGSRPNMCVICDYESLLKNRALTKTLTAISKPEKRRR